MAASGSPGRRDGILDERGRRVEGGRDREDGRQLLVLDADEAGGLLGRVLRLGRDGGHGLAVVLRLADGEDRAILELRPEPRHGLGQIGGRHDEADARDLRRGRRVDRR